PRVVKPPFANPVLVLGSSDFVAADGGSTYAGVVKGEGFSRRPARLRLRARLRRLRHDPRARRRLARGSRCDDDDSHPGPAATDNPPHAAAPSAPSAAPS